MPIKEIEKKLEIEPVKEIKQNSKSNLIMEVETLSFSDKEFFKTKENIDFSQKFEIKKIRVWFDSLGIYGLKFFYEEIDKKSEIEGLNQIYEEFLKTKPFEDLIIEGKLKKIFYKLVGKEMGYIKIICEKEDNNAIEYNYGVKINEQQFDAKELLIDDKKIFLKTIFLKQGIIFINF